MATGASPEERETLMCLIQSGASETATETAGAAMLVMLFVSLWTLIEGEGRGETSEIFPAGASRSLLLLETEMNQRLGTKRINILCILREAAKHYEDSRDGEDSELALVRDVEDG